MLSEGVASWCPPPFREGMEVAALLVCGHVGIDDPMVTFARVCIQVQIQVIGKLTVLGKILAGFGCYLFTCIGSSMRGPQ